MFSALGWDQYCHQLWYKTLTLWNASLSVECYEVVMKSTKPANAPPLGCMSGIGLVYMDYFIIILFGWHNHFISGLFFLDINEFFNRINDLFYSVVIFSCSAMTILKIWDFAFFTAKYLCRRLVNLFLFHSQNFYSKMWFWSLWNLPS